MGERVPSTGLTLVLRGFDPATGKITDAAGGIVLLTDRGEDAAIWSFAGLIEHWNAKHAKAAYVPALHDRDGSGRRYWFGPTVRLGEGTDPLLLLAAIASGRVCYDPAVNVAAATSPQPKAHHRNQFRLASGDLALLYRTFATIDLARSTT